jgi:hypothetical protein
MTTSYAQTVGRMAYIWGWPLVYVYNQRNQLTKVPEALFRRSGRGGATAGRRSRRGLS